MTEEKEEYNKKISEYIGKIITPIFAKKLKVPKEELSNSITTINHRFKYFFRPNNWRRQIEVKEKTDSTISYCKRVIPTIKIDPHTKLISLRQGNIVIQYGKKTLTAIYSCPTTSGVKQGWTIERDSIADINARIDEIKKNIQKTLDDTLTEFSRKFKVFLPFKKPIWGRHEDFIKGESYINKIPKECQFIDTIAKKVYPEKGIEFIGGKGEEPTLHVKTYLKNRAMEDFAPEISNSLNQLSLRFDKFANKFIDVMDYRNKVDERFAVNWESHLKLINEGNKAMKGIEKSFKKFNNLLVQKDLRKWL